MIDTIIRCDEHLKNFTLLDNTCLKTPTLSMQAMGLFAYLMTLPSDWVIHKSELVNHFSNGRDAVYNAFNELVDNGYITYVENVNEKHQFCGYTYYIHEKPVSEDKRTPRKSRSKSKQEIESLVEEETVNGNPNPENPYTENPSLLSTNIQSTNNLNSNSHCRNMVATKTRKPTFKNEEYTKVYDAYFDNCRELFQKGLLAVEQPVLPNYIKGTIKKSFESFGVEKVVDAVKDSINHEWLIEQGYPLQFILGKNELPRLINKTYKNTKSKPIVREFRKLGTTDDYMFGGE